VFLREKLVVSVQDSDMAFSPSKAQNLTPAMPMYTTLDVVIPCQLNEAPS
jgi:hypothetical protein